jgi:hypothetical protein
MSRPRRIEAGTTWMVSRRVTRRHFLLRPDADESLQQIYWFCTAVVAAALGIEVHSVQVLSNHIHEVLTDTRGNLPRFFELRNRLLANCIKCHRGWPEEVFSRTEASYQRLLTPDAIVKEIAYVTVNCVAAFLVRTPRRWPGVKVLVDEIGRRVVTAKRPRMYLDQKSSQWPEEVELRITMPRALVDEYGDEESARAAIQAAVEQGVEQAHAAAKAQGRAFQGKDRVLKTSPMARANSWEDFRSRLPTFVAAGDRKAAASAVAELHGFHADYRDKWKRWKDGDRTVVFPYGTWKIWFCHGALRAPTPS